MNIPEDLQRNPHFARYYRTWQKNDLSIVFIPLAQICREHGLLEEARQICEKGLARHPQSVSGRLMLSRILMDLEQTGEAKALVKAVLEEYPAQQEAKTLHQRLLRMGGAEESEEKSQAHDDSEEVTEKSERAVSLWENPTMAKIYADQGETKIALQIVDRILSRNPQDPRALELRKEWSR